MELKIFIWKTEQQVILEIDMYIFLSTNWTTCCSENYHKEVLKRV